MNEIQDIQSLYNEVREIIASARQNATRSVDFCRVQMYWNIGKRILETEQEGKERAEYGSYLLKNLAKKLEPEYGTGFSYRQLQFCRQFYHFHCVVRRGRPPAKQGPAGRVWSLLVRLHPDASTAAPDFPTYLQTNFTQKQQYVCLSHSKPGFFLGATDDVFSVSNYEDCCCYC